MSNKIFQSNSVTEKANVFTTKPTRQNTGLELRLSYDIVKAHGGELKVETKEARLPARSDHSGGNEPVGRGEGSTFIILLPFNTNR